MKRDAPFSWKPPTPKFLESTGIKTAILFGVLGLVGLAIALTDFTPNLGALDNTMLSGSKEGQYHATVDELVMLASQRDGTLINRATAGSVENLGRLTEESESCAAQFALIQDGLDWRDTGSLELIAQLPKHESVMVLGKTASNLTSFAQIKGMAVGIGPKGSGSAFIAHQILGTGDFKALGLTLTNHPLEEQLQKLQSGELDLGVFVMDEDAPLIADAIRVRGLQMANFEHADVVARLLPFVRTGRIAAGQYDAINVLPPTDIQVLRVGTLVLGNGCAKRSQTMALLSLLKTRAPGLSRYNLSTPNATGLPLNAASNVFFQGDGPDAIDSYFPWVGDIMPPTNWVHVIMAISILFNLMGFANRFRLWRIDANRVKAELFLPEIFGPAVSVADLHKVHCSALDEHKLQLLGAAMEKLHKLRLRCRRQSLSVLVPMGGEIYWRYQEQLLATTVAQLRRIQAEHPA